MLGCRSVYVSNWVSDLRGCGKKIVMNNDKKVMNNDKYGEGRGGGEKG